MSNGKRIGHSSGFHHEDFPESRPAPLAKFCIQVPHRWIAVYKIIEWNES